VFVANFVRGLHTQWDISRTSGRLEAAEHDPSGELTLLRRSLSRISCDSVQSGNYECSDRSRLYGVIYKVSERNLQIRALGSDPYSLLRQLLTFRCNLLPPALW
jgi:hypothetical protein